MTTRLAAVATALALSLAAPASALARTVVVPGGIPLVAVEAGPAWQPRSAGVFGAGPVRSLDSSAKAGNAAQPERPVPQYGNTAGGPAY